MLGLYFTTPLKTFSFIGITADTVFTEMPVNQFSAQLFYTFFFGLILIRVRWQKNRKNNGHKCHLYG